MFGPSSACLGSLWFGLVLAIGLDQPGRVSTFYTLVWLWWQNWWTGSEEGPFNFCTTWRHCTHSLISKSSFWTRCFPKDILIFFPFIVDASKADLPSEFCICLWVFALLDDLKENASREISYTPAVKYLLYFLKKFIWGGKMCKVPLSKPFPQFYVKFDVRIEECQIGLELLWTSIRTTKAMNWDEIELVGNNSGQRERERYTNSRWGKYLNIFNFFRYKT